MWSSRPTHFFSSTRFRRLRPVSASAVWLLASVAAAAQAPAAAPAGTESTPVARPAPAESAAPGLSPRQLRAADDAYLAGARSTEHGDLHAAEEHFLRATELNPRNRDYQLALAVTRQHILADLIHRAAEARKAGRETEADNLLEQARALDPDNEVVRQHFSPDGHVLPAVLRPSESDLFLASRAADVGKLTGPVRLLPAPGNQTLHLRGGAREILNGVCSTWGIRVNYASAPAGPGNLRLDLENTDFATALRLATALTHTFTVPLQPRELLVANDTPDDRAQFEPLIEETLFLPGTTQEVLNEYATMARNIFNLRVVNAVSNSGSLVLRGDEDNLSRANATFADLVDGGAEVLLELTLYEVDRTRQRNIGLAPPGSAGVFSVYSTAQSLIASNQSAINAAIANNLITLTGNTYTDQLTELEFLIATGTVSSSQFSNLLGTIGQFGGLPLAGVFLGSGATLNLLLNSSDVRILDTVQLRAGEHGAVQEATFRAGTRYPIQTGIYSSGVSSSLASSLSGVNINGTSVSSLLSQYGSAGSVSVPQFQFEDLGLTLKATPDIQRSGGVVLKLDLKVESLGSATINTLPVLNNRSLASTVTIPAGQSALLASAVSRSELRAITGFPGLSELPGFQGTDQNKETDTTELLIALTPHIVRNRAVRITSQRLLLANGRSRPE